MINPDGTVPTAPDGMAVITSFPDQLPPETGGETPVEPETVQVGGFTVSAEARRGLITLGILSAAAWWLTR